MDEIKEKSCNFCNLSMVDLQSEKKINLVKCVQVVRKAQNVQNSRITGIRKLNHYMVIKMTQNAKIQRISILSGVLPSSLHILFSV